MFSSDGTGPAISSTKGSTGHLLGATAGLEAIFSILALRGGLLPPTLNLTDHDPGGEGLDLIGPARQTAAIELALSNGFGGVNATMIFRRWARLIMT